MCNDGNAHVHIYAMLDFDFTQSNWGNSYQLQFSKFRVESRDIIYQGHRLC